MSEFLPISRADMAQRGWDQCDFVYVIGDAYVDHPSFGHAIISRVLEAHGYRVGIISQPDWHNPDSIAILGAPRLGFLVMGGNMESLVISITISSVPGFTRMIRSVVLSVVQQDFVEAARSCGTKDSQIVLQHVLPNAIGPIIVNGMMNIAGIIMSAAGLSYIGMGIQPPAPEWGNMLSEAMKGIRNYPHLAIVPGLAIVITALCFNLVGDGLADAIDPRRRQ